MDWLVWGIILLGGALGLLIVEIFVPTAGVLGITAVAVAVVGVVCLFRASYSWGFGGLVTVLITGPTVFFYGLKVYRQTPLGRKMTSADIDEAMAADREREEDQLRDRQKLIGTEGVVVTELRPIGVVRIGEQRYDALSETTLVSAGARVRVTGVEANQLRVRPIEN